MFFHKDGGIEMEILTLEEFINYKFLSGITVNGNGTSAFVVSQQNKKENTYEQSIYLQKKETWFPLTSGKKDSMPLWLSDDTLLFKRSDKEMDPWHPSTSFYQITLGKGEAKPAFQIPLDVEKIEKIGEDEYLVYAQVDLNHEHYQGDDKATEDDYVVIEEIPFWDNGRGYIAQKRDALFIFDAKTQELTKITSEYFEVNAACANDEYIVYSGQTYQDVMSLCSGLFVYNRKNKTTFAIEAQDKVKIGIFAFAGDALIYTKSDMQEYGMEQTTDFYRYDFDKKASTFLCHNDYSFGSTVGCDTHYGAGRIVQSGEAQIYYLKTVGYTCNLYVMNKEGKEVQLTHLDGSILCFERHKNGSIVCIGDREKTLSEIYQVMYGELYQCTDINEEVLRGKYIADCEYCGFVNKDGVELDGWVLKPKDFDPDKTYPAILSMHGGPRVCFGNLFHHEMQVLANQGYFVLFTNPRGSDGKGDAFADIRGKYGDVDYRDFMEFCDHAIKKYPQIDGARLGVAGGSYGGFMTNWIITHTDRFAAAVSQRSFSNWLSDYGISCIGYTFDPDQGGSDPWHDWESLWEMSPVKNANHVKTPTLFIHSMEDYNCPMSEGMQMFTALKKHGTTCRMCLFKGENHELSRSGLPKHRIRRLEELTNWFDRFLKE